MSVLLPCTGPTSLVVYFFLALGVSVSQGQVPDGCDGDMDIVFLLDSSESIIENDPFGKPYYNWEILKNFTKEVVKKLPVDSGDTNVGIIQYASKTIQNLALGRYRNQEVTKEIGLINHMGGYTYTSEGLKQANSALQQGYKSRKVVVILTDGLSNYDMQDTIPQANQLKNQNTEVYAIGLTKYVDEDELKDLASYPDSKYFLHLADFKMFHYYVEVLSHRLCDLPDPVGPTPGSGGPTDPCPEGCDFCNSDRICITCAPGKYLSGSRCVECSEHCSVCNGPRSCELCELNYYWSDQEQRCELCQIKTDLAILIDNSGSINDKGADNYNKLKSFLAAFVNTLDIGKNKTRVGALRFSDRTYIEFLLNRYSTKEGINDAIKRMGYEGSHTNIAEAIRKARTEIFGQSDSGDRSDVSNVALLITDGESTKETNETAREAYLAKQAGIIMFVVGVTNEINLNELHSVASVPVKDHYFNASDIAALEKIFQAILKQVCTRHKRQIRSLVCSSENDPYCAGAAVKAIKSGTKYVFSTSVNLIFQQLSLVVVVSVVLFGIGISQLPKTRNKKI